MLRNMLKGRNAYKIAAFFTLLLVAVLFSAISLVAAGAAPTAKVAFVEGKATFAEGRAGEAKPLAVGTVLSAEHYVDTEADGKVEIKFGDGSVMRIAPNSKIKMKSLLAEGDGKKRDVGVKVEAGKIWATVSKAVGSDAKFEVETDNAVAGVRGTIFRVELADDQATVVKVYTGAVAVNNAPIYKKEGDTRENRRQVQGPTQVTKQQWEELIAQAMQEIRVSSAGQMGKPTAINADAEKNDEWVKWNKARDKAKGR